MFPEIQNVPVDQPEVVQTVFYKSPLGNLTISATSKGIAAVLFRDKVEENSIAGSYFPVIQECVKQLEEYFSGKRKEFSLQLDLQGTDFQKKVWMELLNIPFGKTISYLELARRLGDEKVIRAVGSANGKNPIAIIIPCHRVIGSKGELVGYAGGMHRKKWLLEFESGAMQGELF